MATRDAGATQRRILQAALKEFAAKGIAGSRVDTIAARARTNKRMLYYYFRSKEGLFREILRQRLVRRPDPPTGEMSYGGWLAARLVSNLEHRDYVRLLMWEALETQSRRQPVMAEDERSALYAELRERVRAAQVAGDVPAGLDAGQWLLSELALTIFPVAFPQITRLVTGHAVDDPAFLAERREFLRRFGDQLSGRVVGVER